MKTIIITFALLLGSLLGASAQCIELSGNLNANLTLNANTCYHMTGCFVVPNGITLTIPAGTNILCASGANLVVERGGKLMATGTSLNPIIFTSDQAAGSRQRGDWGGIAIFGKAPNNESLNATREVCIDRTFGGSVSNDNSGTLEYIRIEYAGDITDRDNAAALALYSVGNLTTIDHVQVTESGGDGILALGGTVNMRYLLSLNSYQSGFHFSLGNVSKAQFLLDLRRDAAAHVSSGSYGLFIENDLNGTGNTPLTQPLISNYTGWGPASCGGTVSTDFHDGIRFDHNGAGTLRNSAIGGWPDNGLLIKDALSIGNTATNDLNFSSNAIIAVSGGNLYAAGASWATGCGGSFGGSMADWINGPVVFGCEESGNVFTLTGFGYNADLCDDYCTTRPTLTRTGTALDSTDFSAPFNTFFTNVTYKGAIGATDWTTSWARFCPQTATYCSCDVASMKTPPAGIRFAPNPAQSSTVAYFETAVSGPATLFVLDNITGAVRRSKTFRMAKAGQQQISFSVKGLSPGVYTVKIDTKNALFTGQIVVQ